MVPLIRVVTVDKRGGHNLKMLMMKKINCTEV